MEPNPSTAQARAMADELHRHGVSIAVIAPGSRSSALAIALDSHPGIETRVALDERSAAFFALGHSLASGLPAVAVCTSGTAVANFLPAVVEADLSMVPLILFTADRPPELRHVGANQTIDQVGLFGQKVRWFCDVGLAEADRDLNSYWRTTISQAVARAFGHGSRPGPVHLNLSFREPTVPVQDDGRTSSPGYGFSIAGRDGGEPWQATETARPGTADLGAVGGRAVIVAGQGDYDAEALLGVCQELHLPVLGTALSGLRGRGVVSTYHHLLIDGVPGGLSPEAVVTIGHIGPSDRLRTLLECDVPQVHIDRWGAWRDPFRRSTRVLQADPVDTLGTARGASREWADAWTAADREMRRSLDGRIDSEGSHSGPGTAHRLNSAGLDRLAVASSMPIRDVDAHWVSKALVVANRGASGIDGFVSTALGAATATGPLVALAGDLSFLHDSNGLVMDEHPDAVFVVVDNGGGGLFDLLPQSEHAPAFEKLFVAPHGLDIAAVATAHGISTAELDAPGDLAGEVSARIEQGGVHVVVVPVDREEDLKLRRSLDEVARSAVASL